MSIRLRLTLLYSAILALTLIVFGVGIYIAVDRITFGAAQDAVAAEIRSLAMAIHPYSDPDQGGRLAVHIPGGVVAPQDYVQVRALGGTVIYQSPTLVDAKATLPLDTATRRGLRPDQLTPTIASIGGKRFLVYCTILLGQPQGQGQGPPAGSSTGGETGRLQGQGPPAGPPVAILQVARSLQTVDQTLTALREALLVGGGLLILLAFAAGWALAGTALHPINRISRTAREIGATQDFDRRVAYAGPQDEVGRLAGTFNTMLERLQAAYKAQRRFVADASHELRTPLTTIRGNLGLLQREPPIAEADRVAVLADLVSESERLSRLVGDLLTLARSDARRALRREAVPLDPLLSDLVRRLAVTYPGRQVRAESLPGTIVLGDPDALTQVLLILLDNALKFTPDGGAVAVTSSVDGDHVAIAVRDSGPGIASDALSHIFERFYQGDAARTGTGTGLGLAIARALVEGQQGTIGVASRVGRGSVFTVTLPRALPAPRPELAPTSDAS